MDANFQQPKGRGGALSSLNVAIEVLNLAKEVSDITPAKAAFGSVSVLLTMVRVRSPNSAMMNSWLTSIQDTMTNEQEYIELGLSCADICRVLDRGLEGMTLGNLSRSVCEAINQLTTWVEPARPIWIVH